jgi:hypothetical protein
VAVPALLPDGSIAPESISAIIDATPVEEHPTTAVDAHALTGGRPSAGGGEPTVVDTPGDQPPGAAGALAGGTPGRREEEQP